MHCPILASFGASGANPKDVLLVREIVGATEAQLREASSPWHGSNATSALSHRHLCTRAWRNKYAAAPSLRSAGHKAEVSVTDGLQASLTRST